jgi:hypothetical protein
LISFRPSCQIMLSISCLNFHLHPSLASFSVKQVVFHPNDFANFLDHQIKNRL